ncbi:MAG: hydroxymethylbilane synthase [Chloroflexi bacterium]|nr:hydroxymethylbilane synthase [Chloroflexota bacterium]
MERVIIGSRGSALALWQTEHVIEQLRRVWPDRQFTIEKIKTEGDQVLDVPLASIGSRGLFVKEIENALISGRVDLAVHSLKDLPSQLTPGLTLAAISKREDVRDVLVSRDNQTLDELPPGAHVGTSSPRRAAQIMAYRPDLQVINLRGNLDTRLRKATTAQYDAVVVAAAGVIRLGLQERITQYLPMSICVPAIGQGALAIEARAEDEELILLVAPLDDADVRASVTAERSFMRALGGGCQAPAGAYGRAEGQRLEIEAVVATPDGTRVMRERLAGARDDAERIGQELALSMLQKGAAEILAGSKG